MEYDKMTVAQLKDLLRENDLPVSGKKSELVERLSSISSEKETPKEELSEEEIIDTEEDSIEEESFSEDFFEEDEDFYDDFGGIHTARQKPILDEETKTMLKFRAAQKKKQPAFRRQEWFRYKRLSHSGWRKPKGYQSKQRLNMKYRTPMARIGFGKISAVRGLHSSGFEEVLIHKIEDLESLNPEKQAIRIGSSVGNRKRLSIHDRADDLGLRVLNRRRIDRRGDLQ
ncbi:MAG: 50S ribosomal protein L32e [Euryarchaeota archaeon]|nr:50S ribosomal protein L32e [Euryarchaeota archaeon]|tara:strand:+ start:17329 stop:18012 length:684 start_codon:yes stop_codon:yes gene_type:complete